MWHHKENKPSDSKGLSKTGDYHKTTSKEAPTRAKGVTTDKSKEGAEQTKMSTTHTKGVVYGKTTTSVPVTHPKRMLLENSKEVIAPSKVDTPTTKSVAHKESTTKEAAHEKTNVPVAHIKRDIIHI